MVISEGRGGWGWSGFALELRKFLVFFQLSIGGGNSAIRARESLRGHPSPRGRIGEGPRVGKRLYVEVLVGSGKGSANTMTCIIFFAKPDTIVLKIQSADGLGVLGEENPRFFSEGVCDCMQRI